MTSPYLPQTSPEHRPPNRGVNPRVTTAVAWTVAGAVVVGGTALGIGPLAGAAAPWSGNRADRVTEITEPFTSLSVTTNMVGVRVRYENVPAPRIVESDLAEGMTYRVEDGKLVVQHVEAGGWNWFGSPNLAIVLPKSSESRGPAVEVRAGTGSIDVTGNFGVVDVETQTGSVELDGVYDEVTARTSTGSVDIRVEGDRQPRSVTARTSTGSIDIEVPDGTYAVDARTGTGSTDVEVPTDAASPHRISAETGTGSIDITD